MKYIFLITIGVVLLTSCYREPTRMEKFYLVYKIDGVQFSYSGGELTTTPWFTETQGRTSYPDNDTIFIYKGAGFNSTLMPDVFRSSLYIEFNKVITKQFEDSILTNNLGMDFLNEIVKVQSYGYFSQRENIDAIEINISYSDDTSGYLTAIEPFYYKRNLNDPRFNFEVTEISDYEGEFGTSYKLVTTKFNCVLYDDKGDSITLTDGEMKSLYSAYQ